MKQVIKLPRFDYVLDFAQWDKISAIISAFAKADCKVGFYRKNMYRHYAYDYYAEHTDNCHEVDNYRKLLELIDIKCQKFSPKLRPILSLRDSSPNIKALGKNLMGYVVFHMFPGGSLQKLKKWARNNWLELAYKINKEFGYSILITGAKADLEEAKSFCEMLRQNNIDFYNATGKLSLAETTSVLEKSKMLVTVNTGKMHLASALNVALVVINGATSLFDFRLFLSFSSFHIHRFLCNYNMIYLLYYLLINYINILYNQVLYNHHYLQKPHIPL